MSNHNRGYYRIRESDIPDKLGRLNGLGAKGFAFECVIANLYKSKGYWILKGYNGEDCGYGAYTINRSADKGVDLMVEKDGIPYVIQCKHYSDMARVGSKEVQELLGAYSGNCIFITTSQYTPNARGVAKENPRVILLDWKDIVAEFDKYFFDNE